MTAKFTLRSGRLIWSQIPPPSRPFKHHMHRVAVSLGRNGGSMSCRFASSARSRSFYLQETSKNLNLQPQTHSVQGSFRRVSILTAHLHFSAAGQAGHNKWSKIKRKKAVADMERSRYTHKYVQKIVSAIRTGGGSSDPVKNLRLASVIEQAKAVGVPKSNIESAIQKANSKTASSSTESVLFDARGSSGYFLLIEAVTENIKRTRPQVRTLLEKNGGILGETGSSSFNFEHKALIRVPSSSIKTDPLELAIEIGAEDVISVGEDDDETNRSSSATNVQSLTQVEETNAAEGTYSKQADAKTSRQADDGCLKEQGAKETPSEEELNTPPASMSYQFKCDIDDLRQVINSLKENGVECFTTSFEYIPKTYVSLRLDAYNRANKFVDLLCDHEDVVEVYDNFELEEQS